MIRVSDWDFAADKMSVFMMIYLSTYLAYCIFWVFVLSYFFFVNDIPRSFLFSTSVNLTVDINIKSRLTICPNNENISGDEGGTLPTPCSYIEDWNRVLDASTLLRTQWRFSDNMTKDFWTTCSRTFRFTSYRVHLRDEANWWLFSRTCLFLMKLSTCESIASRFRQERNRWTILSWRGSRDENQVFREQEEESRSLQKRRILLTRMSIPRAFSQRSYHDENFAVTGILDDVGLVTSCADVEIVLKYLPISSSRQCVIRCVAHFTQRPSSLTTSVFRQTLFSRRIHILYCIAHEKKDAVSSRGNRKDLVHIFNVLSQSILWPRS